MATLPDEMRMEKSTVMVDHDKSYDDHHGMKSYSMGDIKKVFVEDLCDEMDDCNKYMDMAHAAEMEDHAELARGLYAMINLMTITTG